MVETPEIDPYQAQQYLEDISEMGSALLAALLELGLALAVPTILTDFDGLSRNSSI